MTQTMALIKAGTKKSGSKMKVQLGFLSAAIQRASKEKQLVEG